MLLPKSNNTPADTFRMAQETAASDRVTLLVGERTFNTSLTTIAPSAVLTRLTTLHSPSEGPYFIDADPDLFAHVLRYLRTGIFPVFYSAGGGHDEPMYHALLSQAKFYDIPKLEDWLISKSYLESVRMRTWAKTITLCGEVQIDHLEELTHLSNETLTVLRVQQTQKKCHRCPQSNWRHNGKREACMKAGCVPLGRHPMIETYEVIMRVLTIDYVVNAVEISPNLLAPHDDGRPSLPPPYNDL